jgi:predicted GIY-YIG superfamily endonuclease
MASITKFGAGWRAHLYIQGRRESKLCRTKYDAERWAMNREAEIRTKVSHDWRPPEVQCLPLDRLRAMPEVLPSSTHAGVYFLWDGDALVYVGQSRKVSHRVAQHNRKPPAPFRRATFIRVAYPWCLAIEQLYIDAYLPYMAQPEIAAEVCSSATKHPAGQ